MASRRNNLESRQGWRISQVRRLFMQIRLAGGGHHLGLHRVHRAFGQSAVSIKADYSPYGMIKRLAEQAVCEWIIMEILFDHSAEEKVASWVHLN